MQPPQGVVACAPKLVGTCGRLAALCSQAWLGVGVCVGCVVCVRTQPHLEGSLFAPTMLAISFLSLGGITPHVRGGVSGVCGSAGVLGMWLSCGCLGG